MNKSKALGSRGELLAAADLIDKGYNVFTEMGDNSPIDLIAVNPDDHSVIKLQVKTATVKDGKVHVYGTVATRSYSRTYDKDDFDYFIVVVPERDIIMYIPIEDVLLKGKSSVMSIRIDEAKNNQTKRVNHYSDYLEFIAK
tara:strand:+ start:64 stop:486 length:423 start_codon:yes stop_codon:yes gene_type:complete